MDGLKRCPACDHENSPQRFFCEGTDEAGHTCGVPLTDVGVAPRRAPTSPTVRAPTMPNATLWLGTVEIKATGGVVLGRAETTSPAWRALYAHPTVSRRHAQIKWNGQEYEIQDLGSLNGTFVNDEALGEGEHRTLRNADRVALSPEVVARWESPPYEDPDP